VEVNNLGDLPGKGPTGHLRYDESRVVRADLRQPLNEGMLASARSAAKQNLWRLLTEKEDGTAPRLNG
jgi:hypothetical protein